MVLLFVVMIVLACCGEVRRKAPINIILLSIFTLIMGFMMGCTSVAYRADEVCCSFFTKEPSHWFQLIAEFCKKCQILKCTILITKFLKIIEIHFKCGF